MSNQVNGRRFCVEAPIDIENILSMSSRQSTTHAIKIKDEWFCSDGNPEITIYPTEMVTYFSELLEDGKVSSNETFHGSYPLKITTGNEQTKTIQMAVVKLHCVQKRDDVNGWRFGPELIVEHGRRIVKVTFSAIRIEDRDKYLLESWERVYGPEGMLIWKQTFITESRSIRISDSEVNLSWNRVIHELNAKSTDVSRHQPVLSGRRYNEFGEKINVNFNELTALEGQFINQHLAVVVHAMGRVLIDQLKGLNYQQTPLSFVEKMKEIRKVTHDAVEEIILSNAGIRVGIEMNELMFDYLITQCKDNYEYRHLFNQLDEAIRATQVTRIPVRDGCKETIDTFNGCLTYILQHPL